MEAVHILDSIIPLSACMILLVAMLGGLAGSGLRRLWAVEDGEKILREDLENPLKSGEGNSVWDGRSVKLAAARNEIVAFQLILEADEEGARGVNVSVSDLMRGPAKIRGSHPLPDPNDYVGVGVELFTEHYLHITTPSWYDEHDQGWYCTTAANPNLTGWTPDALIPFSAKEGRGGAPFDISANSNQGVWVDVYIPKDVPAGTYEGCIEVMVRGSQAADVPIQLQVLDFELPEANHYRSMIYYSPENIAARHGLEPGPELTEMVLRYHRMAHRHRLELFGEGSWDELQALRGTLSGAAFTRAAGYQGPGEGLGNTMYSVNTYGRDLPQREDDYRAESDRWVRWFEQNAPQVDYFIYLTDEPKPSDEDIVQWIRQRADWIHNNPGPGRKLPVFITVQPHEVLVGAVDIWCTVSPRYPLEAVRAAEGRGEPVWLYCGIRPYTPTDMIDEHGVSFRLKPWVAHKHNISRWFTWESTHWYPNHNESPNDRPKNIFVDPVTFTGGTPAGTGHGDGTLFYPGQDKVFPEQDRGVVGPLSSVRLKMYRRGVQDVEYMWLAEQTGYGDEVRALVSSVYPDDMWTPSPVPRWSTRNADYERARRRLAELIRGD
jgi:hypothetical protein